MIRIAVIILFCYAGLIKLIDEETFQQNLLQSPLISQHMVPLVAYAVPIMELLIAVMLVNDKTAAAGALIAFFFMLFFSIYLIGLVNLYDRVPCACGGILGQISYPVHIAFNVAFTGLCLILFVVTPTFRRINGQHEVFTN